MLFRSGLVARAPGTAATAAASSIAATAPAAAAREGFGDRPGRATQRMLTDLVDRPLETEGGYTFLQMANVFMCATLPLPSL